MPFLAWPLHLNSLFFSAASALESRSIDAGRQVVEPCISGST